MHWGRDHPRIRGEHESSTSRSRPSPGSSPHTRGALGILLAIFIQLGIIPAYAGSTCKSPGRSSSSSDHPRIRGEHVDEDRPASAVYGSSPHTRGARVFSPRGGRRRRIIPAYAGSTPSGTTLRATLRDHPRIRGEHQNLERDGANHIGSSPHTRGAHARLPARLALRRIIPAYAGSTCAGGWRRPGRTDHPRIRGEHGGYYLAYHAPDGSSPHTRGARCSSSGRDECVRIIPAYAGSTIGDLVGVAGIKDHPRIRGEHGSPAPTCWSFFGSSPHTRGARGNGGASGARIGIIPAYAGSTQSQPVCVTGGGGSSPHTRGAPSLSPRASQHRGIIPAYAGSTSQPASWPEPPPDHPRIRGEHPLDESGKERKWGSSPHTRGARRSTNSDKQASRIIPAYAGSTRAAGPEVFSSMDHPRIRGEHVDLPTPTNKQAGSSPHTRGAHAVAGDPGVGSRIIPAYAGSTPRAASAS